MPFINIIPEGATEAIEREIISQKASFDPSDRQEFEPAVVQRIEYDNEGQMSQITSLCGESENRRSGENLPKMTIEGILTDDQLTEAKALQQGEEIDMVSDIYTGPVEVRRLTIEQSEQLLTFRPSGSDQEKTAFTFQLQVKQPE
jgi:hypothetical protein